MCIILKGKLTSPTIKQQIIDKPLEKASGDITQDTVPYKQYTDLLQRIEKLEALVEKQNRSHKAAIEELKDKLQVETDMRMLLQAELDKVVQSCVKQV